MFKRVNEYFFGEESITVADGVWFYGFSVVAVLGILFSLSILIQNLF